MLKIKDRKPWAATWASMWMKFDYPTLLPTLNTTSAPLSLPISPWGNPQNRQQKSPLESNRRAFFMIALPVHQCV